MRIAYLGQMADVATENGISKKIRDQGRAWIDAGNEVRYFSLTPATRIWPGLAPLEAEIVSRGGFMRRATRSIQLANAVRAWRPDLIYFRYAYHSPGFPRLFREIPTIAEINSDDLTEYPLTLSWMKCTYHRLTRALVLRACVAFVTVTHELARRFSGFAKPTAVVANGIDFAEIAPVQPLSGTDPLRLVFVGNTGSPWHGLARLADLAQMIPGAEIDVVGCTETDWQIATATRAIPAGLHFHGMLPQSEYAPLVRQATAAIGTLGLFQKQMEEACPLKVREYLAFGLPVIGGYADTDIPESADYFLQLPNSDVSLEQHRQRLQNFLAGWRTRRVPRAAVAHLDATVKERRRLEFLRQFVRAGAS